MPRKTDDMIKFRSLLRLFLFCFLAVCLPVSVQAECRLPDFKAFESTQWELGDLLTYPDKKYGVAYPFAAAGAKGTFYVYDFDVAEPGQAAAKEQLSRAVQEIYQFFRETDPHSELSSPYLVPAVFHTNSRLVDKAVYYTLSSIDGFAVTIVSVRLLNGCFHKMRYTQAVKSTDFEGVADASKGFYILIQTMQQSLEKTEFFK